MKHSLYIFFLLINLGLFAQSPSLINYQGTTRLADGTPLRNKTIGIKFNIRQGSSSGSIIAMETQQLQTNALGLFSTQIGKTTDLSAINWQGNTHFLELSVDTSGGTSFVILGTQQLVSVPYAMYANSVPSSYTNNILSIGNSTYVLSPTIAITPNASITVSGLGTVTSVGTNSFDINIPSPNFTGANATTVNGAYPNYTISSAIPSIALTTSAATGPSVTSSGSSFSLNVPPPTFTNAGPATITGAYPNFTINSSTGTTYTNGAGISLTSGSVIVNTSPNITPSVAVTTTASAGASVTSSGSSFSLNVPPPTFTNAGPATITGAYPNFTINSSTGTTYTNGVGIGLTSGSVIVNTSPNITPSVAVTTTAAAGASVASSGSSFSLNVPPPTFTNAGPATITGAYPNFTINSTAATNYTSGTGISITSGSIINTAPNQTVTFNNTGQTLITGTYPTFSISTPSVANTSIALTSTAAAGPSLSTSGTNSFNINIPLASGWALLGNAGTTPSLNFIGTTDNVGLLFKVNNQKSGYIDPTASASSFFGYQSGLVNTAFANSFFGFQSGMSNTTAGLNSSFGYQALYSNTSGIRNTAIGFQSQYLNILGGWNSSLGANTLHSNTTGNFNTAIGHFALHDNTTGSYNTALGNDALIGHITGDNNTAIGRESGAGNINGSGNVFLGFRAGFYETGSNKLHVANSNSATLIYGDFASGNVAISGTVANAPLQFNNAITGRKIVLWEGTNNDHQVYGFGLSSNTLRYQVDNPVADHAFFAGINSTTSQELMRVKGTGSVGIGVPNPSAKLEVSGGKFIISQGVIRTTTQMDADANTSILGLNGISENVDGDLYLRSYWGTIIDRHGGNAVGGTATNFGVGAFAVRYKTATNTFRTDFLINDVGNVGIGTVAPASIFHVYNSSGDAIARIETPSSSFEARMEFYKFGGLFSAAVGFYPGNASLRLRTMTTAPIVFEPNSVERMRVEDNGRVGIGTTSPATNLHINSTNNFTQVRLTHTATASFGLVLGTDNLSSALLNYDNTPLYFGTNGANRMVISNTGAVGIGTVTPTATLHVNGTTRLVDGTQGAGKVLTSDASGNATWQTSSGGSRTRSIVFDVASLDISAAVSIVPGTKGVSTSYQRPYLQLSNAVTQQFQTAFPIPSDWNGTTAFTLVVQYSCPTASSGNFDMQVLYIAANLNADMTAPTTGGNPVFAANSVANGLTEGTFVLSSFSASNKNIFIDVRRNGGSGTDTSSDPMFIHGIKLEYKD
ncbi:beta strand repeat-containing protein [Aurantibacillus circumpalustris]|uniref:beta strand repeat-containing protein n=1 Tax=Aurantibacillus circumpalustris TaxID=3036359 RepID=UPI00295AFB07|nr:hypothetical protein [Aurantibacillus circumpalustris]